MCNINIITMGKRIDTINYIGPNVKVIYINVECGFSSSYGEYGNAGPHFNVEANGEF